MDYTLADLRTAVLQRVDQENSTFFAEAELLRYINGSIRDLHNLLIQLGGSNFYVKSWPLSTLAGLQRYTLPTDFGKLVRVGFVDDGDEVPLRRWEQAEQLTSTVSQSWSVSLLPRYFLRYPAPGAPSMIPELWFDVPPDAECSLVITYHPKAGELENDADILQYEYAEYLILAVAIKCQQRARKDHAELLTALGIQLEQIKQDFFPVDQADAPRVIDVTKPRWLSPWRPW